MRNCMGSGGRGGAVMKREKGRSFGQFDRDRVFQTLGVVVFGQLCAQPPRLDSDHGVQLGVEIRRATEDFGRDLVFLDGASRMVDRMLGKIPQKLAEGFRAMQYAAVHQSIDLREVLLVFSHWPRTPVTSA